MRWHKLNVILHRDVGYLAFALTIVYGVSGLAVESPRRLNASIRQGPEDHDGDRAGAHHRPQRHGL